MLVNRWQENTIGNPGSDRRRWAADEETESPKARLEVENNYLRDKVGRLHISDEILGNSPELLKLLDRVESVAPTDANVLIMGETQFDLGLQRQLTHFVQE